MEPFPVKCLTRKETACFNSIFSRNGNLFFNHAETRYRLEFVPHEVRCPMAIRLHVRCQEVEIRIALEHPFFSDALISFLEGSDIISLPDDVRPAVMEAALADLLDGFDARFHTKIEILGINAGPTEPDSPYRLCFRLYPEENSRSLNGHLAMDADGLEWLAGLMADIPPLPAAAFDHIPLPASVEIGRTDLKTHEIQELEPYDIILLDTCAFRPDGRVCLRIHSSVALYGTLKNNNIIIDKLGENIMSDDESTEHPESEAGPQKTQAALNPDEIAIRLTFEVGEKRITLGELRNMHPGCVFDLETSSEKPVTIRANGKMIGSGELVKIDERMGVRVLEVFGNAPQ